jgi:hypothetical protein
MKYSEGALIWPTADVPFMSLPTFSIYLSDGLALITPFLGALLL